MTQVDIECIVIGETGVGKTTMVATLNDRHYCRIEPTIGVEFSAKEMDVVLSPSLLTAQSPPPKVKVKVWDTAGQERFRSLIHSYFRNKAIGFIVFDVTSRVSFGACEFWWKTAKEHGSAKMNLVLVGNKCEPKMEARRVVKHTDARDWARSKGIPYYEISARQNAGVKEMFEESLARVFVATDFHPIRQRVSTLDPRSHHIPITSPGPGVTVTHRRPPTPPASWTQCCSLM